MSAEIDYHIFEHVLDDENRWSNYHSLQVCSKGMQNASESALISMINDHKINFPNTESMKQLVQSKKVKTLIQSNLAINATDMLVETLPYCPQLETLGLDCSSKITSEAVSMLIEYGDILHFPKLFLCILKVKKLDHVFDLLKDKSQQPFALLSMQEDGKMQFDAFHHSFIKEENDSEEDCFPELIKASYFQSKHVGEDLKTIPNVKTLCFCECEIDQKDVDQLLQMTSLSHLYLEDCTIDKKCLKLLTKSNITQVFYAKDKQLSIYENKPIDSGQFKTNYSYPWVSPYKEIFLFTESYDDNFSSIKFNDRLPIHKLFVESDQLLHRFDEHVSNSSVSKSDIKSVFPRFYFPHSPSDRIFISKNKNKYSILCHEPEGLCKVKDEHRPLVTHLDITSKLNKQTQNQLFKYLWEENHTFNLLQLIKEFPNIEHLAIGSPSGRKSSHNFWGKFLIKSGLQLLEQLPLKELKLTMGTTKQFPTLPSLEILSLDKFVLTLELLQNFPAYFPSVRKLKLGNVIMANKKDVDYYLDQIDIQKDPIPLDYLLDMAELDELFLKGSAIRPKDALAFQMKFQKKHGRDLFVDITSNISW